MSSPKRLTEAIADVPVELRPRRVPQAMYLFDQLLKLERTGGGGWEWALQQALDDVRHGAKGLGQIVLDDSVAVDQEKLTPAIVGEVKSLDATERVLERRVAHRPETQHLYDELAQTPELRPLVSALLLDFVDRSQDDEALARFRLGEEGVQLARESAEHALAVAKRLGFSPKKPKRKQER